MTTGDYEMGIMRRYRSARGFAFVILPILLLSALTSQPLMAWGAEGTIEAVSEVQAVHPDQIDLEAVYRHVRNLSSMGSRVTGYPGFYNASDYIAGKLREYGLEVITQEYPVMVPIDVSTSIRVLSPSQRTIDAFALWPNYVQTSVTPPEGITGRLIFVGNGDLKDFDDKIVNGSIVLMEFNSWDNWLNAAKLGAKAVVFIEPADTSYYECLQKFVQTPIHFPRVYVRQEEGYYLKGLAEREDCTVNLVLRMSYMEVMARNIIGVINGTRPDDIVILSSHFDSWSVVPALSPAAEEAVSTASLLELARQFAKNQPERTTWFAFLSGHWQATAGAREFVEKFAFSSDVEAGNQRIWMQINLDLNTNNRAVSLIYTGFALYFPCSEHTLRLYWVQQKVYDYLTPVTDFIEGITHLNIREVVRATDLSDGMWWGTQPIPYMLDSEALMSARTLAFTVSTSYNYRWNYGLPISDLNLIDLDNLYPQLVLVANIGNGFVNDNWELDWSSNAPSRGGIGIGGVFSGTWVSEAQLRTGTSPNAGLTGLVTILGAVKHFDTQAGWYTKVPNATVVIRYPGNTYPFFPILTRSDENGSFSAHGLQYYRSYSLEAYVVNETDGAIEYVTDLGMYGSEVISPSGTTFEHPTYLPVIVTECASVTFYDIFNVRTMRRTQIHDPRLGGFNSFYSGGGLILPYDATSRSEMTFYSHFYNGWETVGMAFVSPGSRFDLTFTSGLGRPIAVLSKDEATGYEVKGKRLEMTLTPYRFASDLYSIARSRYDGLARRNARSLAAEELLEAAEEHLLKAEAYFGNRLHKKGYEESLTAWAYASKAYGKIVMPMIDDASMSAFFFVVLMAALVPMLERLMFHQEYKRRITYVSIMMLILLAIFYIVHPALSLMANSVMNLLAAAMFIVLVIVGSVLWGEASGALKSIAVQLVGRHQIQTRRPSFNIELISLSLENMRRHRLRVALTMATLVILTTSLTALTSTSPGLTVGLASTGATSTYNGLLIRKLLALPPEDVLDRPLILAIDAFASGKASILPRVWYYPVSTLPSGNMLITESDSASLFFRAAMGVTPEETELWNERGAIASGRHFINSDHYVCILPLSAAQALGVDVGESVDALGKALTVVGFLDGRADFADMDGLSIFPMDPEEVEAFSFMPPPAGRPSPRPLEPGSVIVLPYRLASELGGYISSVSIRFNQEVEFDEARRIASGIALETELPVYIGLTGQPVEKSAVKTAYYSVGWEMSIMLGIMCSLNVLVVMLGNIKERSNEFTVFSSLGLAPSSAAMIAFSEALTYGLLSTLIGYFLGFALNSLFVSYNLLPSNFLFNYASSSIVVILLSTLAAALLSTVYPATIATKIITPSLQRRWKPSTKPQGDMWVVPLPLRVSDDEFRGMLLFLEEYYAGAGQEKGTHLVTEVSPSSVKEMKLEFTTILTPFESGVHQRVTLQGEKTNRDISATILLRRLSGSITTWESSGYRFLDDLRKQTLLWRALGKERSRYIQKAQSMLAR